MEPDELDPAKAPARVVQSVRRPILATLKERGAMSFSELVKAEIRSHFVPLTNAELAALLDSARRAQLIEALDDAERPDGVAITEQEWVLTDLGRNEVTGLGAFLSRFGSLAGAFVRGVIPLATALGVGGLLKGLDASPWTIAGVAAVTLYTTVAAAAVWWSARVGAGAAEVLEHWPRLKSEERAATFLTTSLEAQRRARWFQLVLFTYIVLQLSGAHDELPVLGQVLVFLAFIAVVVWNLRALQRSDRAGAALRGARPEGQSSSAT
jgi:hypothetical protein